MEKQKDETKNIPVNHKSGYRYFLSIISLEEADELIKIKNGIFLKYYSNAKKQKETYLLNTGELLQKSYVDALLYSTFYGFLLDLHGYEKMKKKKTE